jgi:hypothetical protein
MYSYVSQVFSSMKLPDYNLVLLSHLSHANYSSAHLILFDLIVLMILVWVTITEILITHFLQPPVTSPLRLHILLCTFFSNTLDESTNITFGNCPSPEIYLTYTTFRVLELPSTLCDFFVTVFTDLLLLLLRLVTTVEPNSGLFE